MDNYWRDEVLAAFLARERRGVTLPTGAVFGGASCDFIGWVHRSGHVAYFALEQPKGLQGIVLGRSPLRGAPGRGHTCGLCGCTHGSNGLALFSRRLRVVGGAPVTQAWPFALTWAAASTSGGCFHFMPTRCLTLRPKAFASRACKIALPQRGSFGPASTSTAGAQQARPNSQTSISSKSCTAMIASALDDLSIMVDWYIDIPKIAMNAASDRRFHGWLQVNQQPPRLNVEAGTRRSYRD